MSFHYSRKICIFPKRLTHDSSQAFQISRREYCSLKVAWDQAPHWEKKCKKRGQIGKISVSDTARIVSLANIFPIWPCFLLFFPSLEPGPNADFSLLFPTIRSLVPGYLRETSVLSFDDVVFSKEGFLDDKNVILL